MKRKTVLRFLLFLTLAAFSGWVAWDNARIVVTDYEISSKNLPKEFDGYKIVQISDLHNDEFGKDNCELIDKIKEIKPDMIAITGDLLDSRRTNVEKAYRFIEQAVCIAPCYYVTGNHESRRREYLELEEKMLHAGVKVLRDKVDTLTRDGASLTVAGMEDPCFYVKKDTFKTIPKSVHKRVEKLTDERSNFTLLLSHRPELFDVYCQYGMDVVLTGHVHGGQFRLPWLGGIVAPNQGFFPRYDAGLYEQGDTKMVLSRGLGQSAFPFRVNNPPELVVVTLKADE